MAKNLGRAKQTSFNHNKYFFNHNRCLLTIPDVRCEAAAADSGFTLTEVADKSSDEWRLVAQLFELSVLDVYHNQYFIITHIITNMLW